MLTQKIKASIIVDLLLEVLDRISQLLKGKKKESRSSIAKTNRYLLPALLGYASAKYIKEVNEEDFEDEHYIERAVRISSLAMDHTEQ
jgi:preprotein translocase subunit SecY